MDVKDESTTTNIAEDEDIQQPADPAGKDEDIQQPADLIGPTDKIENAIKPQAPWRARLAPWGQATLAVLPAFILTRIVFILLTYFGTVLFTVSNYSYQALPLSTILRSWYRWDAIHFQAIATQGYAQFENTAFFPLYPLLERQVAALLHIHTDVFLAGMLIGNIAFLATMIVLFRYVETEFDRDTAKRATLYLAIFPSALFFFAAYNESLFLFFALISLYAMRRSSWWIAGIFGGLAVLTRSVGMALLPVFLYEFVRQVWPLFRETVREKAHQRSLLLLTGLLPGLLIPCGLGIYSYYLSRRFGDPIAYSHAQSIWRLGPIVPWYAPIVAIRAMLTFSPFTFSTAHNFIDFGAFVLFAILLLLCFVGPERFAVNQWGIIFFGVMALGLPLLYPGTSYNPMPAMERYVLEVIPCFILLARYGRRPWFHQAYLILSLPMLAFLTLQFLTGHWIT
jgi:Mannosyltransferase (PIG-V)